MKVISLLNQKGGVGKTTLTVHIARALEVRGYKVAIVDTDPQETAQDWSKANPDSELTVIGIDTPTLEKKIPKLLGEYDFVVIDGIPSVANISLSAIAASDLVVIPVVPSSFAVWATEKLIESIHAALSLKQNLKAGIVLNQSVKGTSIEAEVHKALSGFGLPVFKTIIHQKVDKNVGYEAATRRGLTVTDINPNGNEAREINALLDEILSLVNGVTA